MSALASLPRALRAAVLGLLLAAPAAAQLDAPPPAAAPEVPGPQRLRTLSAAERLRLEGHAACFDAESWRARLSDLDLDRREQAFAELVRQLGRCAHGVATLEAWAASAREPQLAWTARLALRELRDRQRTFIIAVPPGGLERPIAVDLGDARRVGAQLELLEGPLQAIFQGRGELSLYAPRRVVFQAPPPEAERQRRFSVEAGPEEVVLRITESADGEERTREYRAPSLAALLEEQPALAEEVPGLRDMAVQPLGERAVAMRWSTGPVRLRVDPFGLRERPEALRVPGLAPDGEAPQRQKLGIECRPATAEERGQRGLPDDLGVRVEFVLPGTVAHLVELKRGDVLVTLDGRPLRECDDIARALAARPAEAPLVLELVDTESQRRTVTWEPQGAR